MKGPVSEDEYLKMPATQGDVENLREQVYSLKMLIDNYPLLERIRECCGQSAYRDLIDALSYCQSWQAQSCLNACERILNAAEFNYEKAKRVYTEVAADYSECGKSKMESYGTVAYSEDEDPNFVILGETAIRMGKKSY